MTIKAFFKKYGIHFIAVGLFLIIGYAFFSPQFGGYGLKQHDIEQFRGMSNEIKHFREATGEEPLWTNSMFGGMPATQIHVLQNGNVPKEIVRGILKIFPIPMGVFLIHLICFYILALCLRVKPIIGILGAFVFAFASYEIIILQAGHNTKAMAVAIAPAVIGAFVLAFRQNWKLGGILSALFMTAQLGANHFQVTYYIMFLLLSLGVYFFIVSAREKKLKKFFFSTGAIMAGYLVAIAINYGNISMTNSYSKHTIRGANDLTLTPGGLTSEVAAKGGLDKDYITNWSYGIDESFSLITPYAKGSHNSFSIGETRFADLAEDMDISRSELKTLISSPSNRAYWGDQPITSGPVYLGVIVIFLALLGMFFLKTRIKWVFLGISVFALLLSWGKNFMGLTDLFIDYMPLYDKFRTVTIILILVELSIPIIGILLLQRLYENRDELKQQSKKFLIISGAFVVFLLGLKVVKIDSNYSSERETSAYNEETLFKQYSNQILSIPPEVLKRDYGINPNNPQQLEQFANAQVQSTLNGFQVLKNLRKEIYNKSTSHSLLFGLLGIAIVALFFFTSLPSITIVALLGIISITDLVLVDLNYLNSDPGRNSEYQYWSELAKNKYPISANEADYAIMQSEAEDPRLAKIIEKGKQKGNKKAQDLDYSRGNRQRVIDSYAFSALNLNSNYRVFDYDGGWSSSRSSYFHKALGGYHGAKLRSIQNIFEFHISKSNNDVIDMLNVRYLIQKGKMAKNPTALGNAWFVKRIKTYKTPDEEIRGLGKEFLVKNEGNGQLLVNGENVKDKKVYGPEKMVYVSANRDSIPVNLSNGIPLGLKVFLIIDVNGETTLVPETTIENDTLKSSFKKLVSMELKDDFTPGEEAILLDSEASKLKGNKFSGEGNIELVSYAPNKLTYSSNTNQTELAIFSEVYYEDGWKAYIDGKEQEILKVNYILRGLEVPAGKHDIEFVYALSKYNNAKIVAWTGSILIFLLLIGNFYWTRKTKVTAEKKN